MPMEPTKGPARASRRAALGVLAAPPLAWLAGCSPELDWREIRAEDAGVLVMLPAKPARMVRAINLEGLSLEMTMVGAQVREIAYTVGTVVLPEDSDAMRARALASMRAAMVRNIGGTVGAERAVQVLRVDMGGQRTGSASAVEIEAGGRMRDREATLIARFVAVGAQAWQAVVLGARPEREAAALFLESLKLMR
jgi:hypothetical protein